MSFAGLGEQLSYTRRAGMVAHIHGSRNVERISTLCWVCFHYSNRLWRTWTILSPASWVPTWPPRSFVRMNSPPLSWGSKTILTAVSIASACFAIPREYLSNIAALSIVAIGLAIPWPAMSGAEPCIGSYNPAQGSNGVGNPAKDAEGSSPSEPGMTLLSSERLSEGHRVSLALRDHRKDNNLHVSEKVLCQYNAVELSRISNHDHCSSIY